MEGSREEEKVTPADRVAAVGELSTTSWRSVFRSGKMWPSVPSQILESRTRQEVRTWPEVP